MKKIIVPIMALFFIGCQEDVPNNNIDSAATVEVLTEYAIVNEIFQDVGNNTGDAVLSSENTEINSKFSKKQGDGPIITVEPFDLVTFPKTITIDYQSGVLCNDGVTRKGVATIVSTNWYGVEGSEHTTTFSDYYHNDYKVEGTHFIQNLGETANGNMHFSVIIEDGKITSKTGQTIHFTENSTRTWIAGDNTPLNIWDDEYLLDGTQSGKSGKGTNYTLTVEEPLHFMVLPRSIKSGLVNMDVGNVKDIKVNYTTSTVTILGTTFPF